MLSFAAAGCGNDETAPETHTPHAAKLFVGTTELTPLVQLAAGQTHRIEVRFFADDGDEITGIEDHFAALTLSPGTLATVAAVAGHHFQFDVTVTAASGATGNVTVGFGHDAAADELSFGPFAVQIVP
jgi:hypothetical protein